MQNINDLNGYYLLVASTFVEVGSEVAITDCLFENLQDVVIAVDTLKVTVINSTFNAITQTASDFFTLFSTLGSDLVFTFINNTVE